MPNELLQYSFDDLVQSLEGRRRLGEDPPVLLLGAGASAAAGLATMRRLYESEGIAPEAPDAFEEFCRRMERRDDRERFRWLAAHLQTADPQQVTPGYRALAALCARHLFDVVLTANLDPLLEDAFAATSLKRRDYLVLVNGVLRKDRLPLLLLPGAPRVKVVKIHGDLFHRFMAWTPGEMEAYLRDITPALSRALAYRDVLVVGYSLRDQAVRELALGTEGTVWFANPGPPAAEIAAALAERRVRVITSPQCRFEEFFTGLAAALSVPVEPVVGGGAPLPVAPPPAPSAPAVAAAPMVPKRGGRTRGGAGPAAPAAPAVGSGAGGAAVPAAVVSAGGGGAEVADNLDEVLAATLGIVGGGEPGYVAFTGFLLAEPRVILTDAWAAGQMDRGGRGDRTLRVVTQGGTRLEVRRLGVVSGNPFGPLVLEAPPALQVAGLRLEAGPLRGGEPIEVAVGTSLRRAILEGAMTVEAALSDQLLDESQADALRRELSRRRADPTAAAGEAQWQKFALSHGRVRTGERVSLEVSPIGRVDGLVRLELAVAPGSCGAPVVDGRCALRGFIVAGSVDPARPDSYLVPASGWGRALAERRW